jgi:CrcB protein
MPLTHALWLAAAGAAGTLLRAGANALSLRLFGPGFPWGTLAVNVIGSFAFGAIVALARSRGSLSTAQETIIFVGLLGGFTTYSSFAFQSVEMLEAGRVVPAVAYVVGTTLAALFAVWAGLRLFPA